jgi:hypothetical protein
MSTNLSKSLYCSGVQCPKMLWLKKHRPELFDDSVMDQNVLETGLAVGDLAMGLFGEFREVPYGDLTEMIAETERLLKDGVENIAEASFAYDGMFCSVDILRNLPDGKAELYEVKSSTSVHEIYYHDVAYQMYMLEHLGFTVTKACLVHLDRSYVRGKELEIEKLFKIEDLTEQVRAMQGDVEARTASLKQTILNPDEPGDDIGPHCSDPYDCGFWHHCTEHLPVPNVFDVSGMQKRTKFKYYNQGVISFEELASGAKLNDGQRLQISHALAELPDQIDRASIRSFLSGLSYPLYFLDFESFQPAVPLYENSSPYDQIVFQYSLDLIEGEGEALQHKEYLGWPGEDPRRKLAEQLCRDIPMDVCTTAYNMGFEKGRIKELATLYPDLANHLMNIYDHIEDLMIPFRERWYYSRAMQGSYSIKYVLPALYPDDPELDYHSLDGVHNGAEASAAFTLMQDMDAEELQKNRENLLRYCGLDTLAMVKLFDRLEEAAKTE